MRPDGRTASGFSKNAARLAIEYLLRRSPSGTEVASSLAALPLSLRLPWHATQPT